MTLAPPSDESSIPVVILAGGMGTRLREETEYRPKPMVPIGHQPIIWHIMRIYAQQGFKNFIVCLGYRGEVIRKFFSNYSTFTGDLLIDMKTGGRVHLGNTFEQVDWRVTLVDTGRDTLTGGRLLRVRDYIHTDHFMLTYGDGVANVDIQALLATHRRTGAVATVTGVQPTSRFGELHTDGDLVTSFHEKEFLEDVWINGGFFVFSRKIFDQLSGDACTLEQEPLRQLAATRQLAVHRHRGYWQNMDTYREYELLNRLWNEGHAPWKIW